MPRLRRTIRRPTRWTPDEWRQIEDAARACGVPPLRYVREAALAAKLAPRARRRGAHELVRQIKRVLNNLNQLAGVAHDNGAERMVGLIRSTALAMEDAVQAAAACPAERVPELVAAVVESGRNLNAVAHRANGTEDLPPDLEVIGALEQVLDAVGPLFVRR
jgi:hypothetical protein